MFIAPPDIPPYSAGAPTPSTWTSEIVSGLIQNHTPP